MAYRGDKTWQLLEPDKDLVAGLSSELEIDPLIARLIINRGVEDAASARVFLEPSLADLHDPFLMHDMERAVLRVRSALMEDEEVVIFGDDDVDGVTSTTVLYQFLQAIGIKLHYFIPERFVHGHGFTRKALRAALDLAEKPTLLIATDCGLSSHEEIAELKAQGVDTIIVDHHALPRILPEAIILNPKMPEDRFPFKELAAVGVAFSFIHALRLHFEKLGVLSPERGPQLEDYLDLVCLGTVADVVPLLDENRTFVRLGLEVLKKRRRCGTAALLEKTGTDGGRVNERTICYRLAPRINAAGRVGNPNQCVSLLSSERYALAQQLAGKLEHYNSERQKTEATILEEAIAIGESLVLQGHKVLVVGKEDWHQGVLGIVASRLLERFQLPTILLTTRDGIGRGSARSLNTFNILNCIAKCEHLLVDFGGHSAAAGLTIEADKVEAFKACLMAAAEEELDGEELPVPPILIDSVLSLGELSYTRIQEMEALSPFGAANREPSFLLKGLRLVRARTVGRNHLKLRLRGDRTVIDVIGFAMGGLELPRGRLFDVVVTPRISNESPGNIDYQLLAIHPNES